MAYFVLLNISYMHGSREIFLPIVVRWKHYLKFHPKRMTTNVTGMFSAVTPKPWTIRLNSSLPLEWMTCARIRSEMKIIGLDQLILHSNNTGTLTQWGWRTHDGEVKFIKQIIFVTCCWKVLHSNNAAFVHRAEFQLSIEMHGMHLKKNCHSVLYHW